MIPTILIVDDEENIRFAFESILTDEQYNVFTADNYHAALDLLYQTSPDLIISDIILGSHSGLDLLAMVKKKGLNCPVIMITGYPNIETSADAVRLGAFDYVPKPIRKDTLLRITSHALVHKSLLDKKKNLEQENLRVRKNMEAIFSSLKDGIITVDRQAVIIEANTAVETICTHAPKSIMGKTYWEAMTQCSGQCFSILDRTLKTGKSTGDVKIECNHDRAHSQVVSVTATPLQSEGTRFSGAVLVIRNITQLTTLEKELKKRSRFHRIVGKSHQMQNIYSLVENLADTDTTVLITGETGTGKELIARAIHHNSHRKDHPFITVNCSALSENLLESELFGHIKGAFTGAVHNKKGRFELAAGGTIFLDEIGDISPLVQLKLLRVLQEKEFERVGDSTPLKTDVRILAATHRDLEEYVRVGQFRKDLYYRIKVVQIPLPTLRQRRDDIPLLTNHFLNLFNNRFTKHITGFQNSVINTFMNYPWPGNIRELEHAVEHGFVLCQDGVIRLDHIPVEIKSHGDSTSIHPADSKGITKDDLLKALHRTDWNKAKAARLLGISRRTIYRKLTVFNIRQP